MVIDYTVTIRTLGTSGHMYERLLQSIKKQTIKPREVLIIMAEGYTPPSFHIENERIIFVRKGMVNQRFEGFRQAKSEYLLVVDDDIEFESNFVENLFRQMKEYGADCMSPRTIAGSRKKRWDLRNLLLGVRRYSSKPSPFFLRIGMTGGTIICKQMLTRGGARCKQQISNVSLSGGEWHLPPI